MKNLRIYIACVLFILAEIGLFLSYNHHDGRFHWFLHFFVGASVVLLIMSVVTWRTRRLVCFPLLWILISHLFAMFPDILFKFFSTIHQPWMDLFFFHISGHFLPGRNWSWYGIFLASLGVYLTVSNKYGNKDNH